MARVPLDVATVSRLTSLTLSAIPEFKAMDEIAETSNLRVAAYGGTAREVTDLVIERVNTLGSVDAYVNWLKSQSNISIVDWHRLQSDLDVMLIPNEGADVPISPQRMAEIDAVRKKIDLRFPQSVFYKRIDLIVPQEFFVKYPVGNEHFEPISNLAITAKGVERLPQLNVEFDGKKINMGDEGLRQFASGQLDFRLNPSAVPGSGTNNTFGLLRQALRWIRYLSEYPDSEVTPETDKTIRTVVQQLERDASGEVQTLLRDGHSKYKPGKPSFAEGAKLIEQLEKLQLYSKNSAKTRKLLETYGIVKMAEAAGIAKERILVPIPQRPKDIPVAGKKLGKEIVVRHRTSLNAAQNISRGALWASNDSSMIGDKAMQAANGPGLYAAHEFDSLSYGDHYVSITLSAEAVEGVDFRRQGQWFVIMTENAIARDAGGNRKIDRVTQKELLRNLTEILDNRGLQRKNRLSVLRGIGGLLNPETSSADFDSFKNVYAQAEQRGIGREFLASLLSRPHLDSHLSNLQSPLRKWLSAEMKSGFDTDSITSHTGRINAAELVIPAGMTDQAEIAALPAQIKRDFLNVTYALPEEMRARYDARLKILETESDPSFRLAVEFWKSSSRIPDEASEQRVLALLKEIPNPDRATLSQVQRMVDYSKKYPASIGEYLYQHLDLIDDPAERARIAIRAGYVRPDLFRALNIDGQRSEVNIRNLVKRLGPTDAMKKTAAELMASRDPKAQAIAVRIGAAQASFSDIPLEKLALDFDFRGLPEDVLEEVFKGFQAQPSATIRHAQHLHALSRVKLSEDSMRAGPLRRAVISAISNGGVEALRAVSDLNGDALSNLVRELSDRKKRDLPTEKLLLEWLEKTSDAKMQSAILDYFWKSSLTFGRDQASKEEPLFKIAAQLAEKSTDPNVRRNAYGVLSWNFRDRPEVLEIAARNIGTETDHHVLQSIYGAAQSAVYEKPFGTYNDELAVAAFEAMSKNPAGNPQHAKFMLECLEWQRGEPLRRQAYLDQIKSLRPPDPVPAPVKINAVVSGPVALEQTAPVAIRAASSTDAVPPSTQQLKGLRRFLPECAKWFEKLRKR
ncbi:MAG: hypothetical protein J0L82_04200 [Deltaproteobacteria bacterium]|nr:hypothetical protein [Deltaproteobacteria bacterium]